MNQKVIYSASTALIAGLLVSNLAWAQMNYPINNTDFINNTDPNDPRYLDRRYPVMDTRIERRQAYYSYNNYGNGYPSQEYPYSRAYDYSYDNGNPFGIVTAPIAALAAPVTALTAPIGQAVAAPFAAATDATTSLMTGRSVATAQMGKMCSTPVKSCELYQTSWVGNGCSCKISGGRSRGTVTP